MAFGAAGQFVSPDSLRTLEKKLLTAEKDTNRVELLRVIGSQYLLSEPEIARKHFDEGLELSRQLNYKKGEADCLRWTGNLLKRAGQYPEAMDYLLKGLKICEEIHYQAGLSASYGHIGDLYIEEGDYAKARPYLFRAKEIDEETDNHFELVNVSEYRAKLSTGKNTGLGIALFQSFLSGHGQGRVPIQGPLVDCRCGTRSRYGPQ